MLLTSDYVRNYSLLLIRSSLDANDANRKAHITLQPYGPVRGQLHHHAGMYRTQRRSPRGGMTSGDEQGDDAVGRTQASETAFESLCMLNQLCRNTRGPFI